MEAPQKRILGTNHTLKNFGAILKAFLSSPLYGDKKVGCSGLRRAAASAKGSTLIYITIAIGTIEDF